MTTGTFHDPRSIITPDAFDVSTELLGMPLASPRRRAVAILIDLMVIGFLTIVTKSFALVLGVVASIFFMRAGFKRTEVRRSVFNRAMRASVGCLGIMVGLITALLWVSFGIDFGGGRNDEGVPANVVADVAGSSLGDAAIGFLGATALEAEFQDAESLEEATDVLRDLALASEELGVEPERLLEIALAAVPEGAAWADDAEAAFAGILTPETVEPEVDADLLAALAITADTLEALQERIGDLEDDLSDEERRRREAQRALEDETSGGFFDFLWDLVDELGFGFGWASLYLTIFLSWWNGQTVGKKLMGIRVVRLDGEPITWWIAFERAGGYAAGFATGLLGFAQVWWDANRQAIHDRIVGTVVVMDGAEKVLDWEKAL